MTMSATAVRRGLLGVFTTCALGGVAAATIAGQLTMSVLLDRAGALGLEERGLTLPRVVGIGLLAAGTFLIVRE